MVIGADREPQWIIKSFNNSSLSLVLDASSENIKTKTYYSEKWLRQVEIKEQYDKSSELTINLQSDPNQVGIFWMPVGDRLVLDLFQNPDNRIIAALSEENNVNSHGNIMDGRLFNPSIDVGCVCNFSSRSYYDFCIFKSALSIEGTLQSK